MHYPCRIIYKRYFVVKILTFYFFPSIFLLLRKQQRIGAADHQRLKAALKRLAPKEPQRYASGCEPYRFCINLLFCWSVDHAFAPASYQTNSFLEAFTITFCQCYHKTKVIPAHLPIYPATHYNLVWSSVSLRFLFA